MDVSRRSLGERQVHLYANEVGKDDGNQETLESPKWVKKNWVSERKNMHCLYIAYYGCHFLFDRVQARIIQSRESNLKTN